MDKVFKILIADPNPYIRSFLSRELSVMGNTTVEAANCKEIFKLLKDGYQPDLIVIDLDFPLIKEMKVLKRIQNFVPTIPQVIYSQLSEYENHPCAEKADAFVDKSGDPIELFQAINLVLQKKHATCSNGTLC